MSEGSEIGWLNRPGHKSWTLNVGIGCTPVSAGCDFCYAPKSAARQAHYEGRGGIVAKDALGRQVWTGEVKLFEERLQRPLKVKRPCMIFVNALMDLFSAAVPEEFIAKVWQMMAATPQHTYVILTKQPKRMRDIVRRMVERFGILRNVWLGVSIENQHTAEIRVRFLLETPAAVRAVSCEPLLAPIRLTRLHLGGGSYLNALSGIMTGDDGEIYAAAPGCVDWVIVGGESGRREDVRPMHPTWARSLRDQAVTHQRAFFFKQWGSWGPAPWVVRVCDPAEGWKGTDAELAAAKAAAEAIGATHSLPVWADQYDMKPTEAEHKPWGAERHELPDDTHAPLRFYRGKSAGHQLDGREWLQWPTADGLIEEAPRELATAGGVR
jgi:protein gp37